MPRIARLNQAVWLLFAVGVFAATASRGRETPATDLLGDPLPDGAVARLGTTRLRTGTMIRSLCFFPDGKTLLSTDWYGVRVWDAVTGRLLRRFGDPHGRQFQDGAFSPDGSLAALSMSEGEIGIWDSRKGQLLRQFHAGRFPGMVFSPDGKTLAVHDHSAVGGEALALGRDERDGITQIAGCLCGDHAGCLFPGRQNTDLRRQRSDRPLLGRGDGQGDAQARCPGASRGSGSVAGRPHLGPRLREEKRIQDGDRLGNHVAGRAGGAPLGRGDRQGDAPPERNRRSQRRRASLLRRTAKRFG